MTYRFLYHDILRSLKSAEQDNALKGTEISITISMKRTR